MTKRYLSLMLVVICCLFPIVFEEGNACDAPVPGTVVRAYSIEQYEYEWCSSLSRGGMLMGSFAANMCAEYKFTYNNDEVRKARLPALFDSADLTYWHAHTHTIPLYGIGFDGWGTPAEPYLAGDAAEWNPSWFEGYCAFNSGPGYTSANLPEGYAVGLPTYHGGTFPDGPPPTGEKGWGGQSLLTVCDLASAGPPHGPDSPGLGDNALEWLVLDSCMAVVVVECDSSGDCAPTSKGVYAWDQSFAGMHSVLGHYVPIIECDLKKFEFPANLNAGMTVWNAYSRASLNCGESSDNDKVAIITAEAEGRRVWNAEMGVWEYPGWNEMAIADHWWGMGDVSDDIPWDQPVSFFFTAWWEVDSVEEHLWDGF